jgi:hypothetical protein
MRLKLNVKGFRELKKALKQQGPRAEQSLARALFTEGERIMTEAKRLTPVDTGALRASGHVQKPVIRRGRIEVTLGFGGPSAPYAVIVHENLNVRHQVGQAKFLEKPLNEAARGLAERIAAEVRRQL